MIGPIQWPDFEWMDRFEAEKRARRRPVSPLTRMMESLEAAFQRIAAEQAEARRAKKPQRAGEEG